MYDQIDVGAEFLDTAAKYVIANDRIHYVPALAVIERLCAAKRWLIGGPQAVSMTMGAPVGIGDFMYHVYAPEPFDAAKQIATEVWRELSGTRSAASHSAASHAASQTDTPAPDQNFVDSISVETVLKHKYMILWLNTRQLAQVRRLPTVNKRSLVDFIAPLAVQPRFFEGAGSSPNLLLESADMQLIGILRGLYTPYGPFQDKKYTDYVEALCAVAQRAGYATCVGGSEKNKKSQGRGSRGSSNASDLRAQVYNIVGKALRDVPGLVIVGDWALSALAGASHASSAGSAFAGNTHQPRLQVLLGCDKACQVAADSQSAADAEAAITKAEVSAVKTLCEIVGRALAAKNLRQPKVTFVRFEVNLPTDLYLTKYGIYLELDGLRAPIIDCFNSLSYEQIPTRLVDRQQHGNLFVLARFKLIDAYIAKTVAAISGAAYDSAKHKQQLAGIFALIFEALESDPLALFQLRDYAGVYVTEAVLRKRASSVDDWRFSRYYPALAEGAPDQKNKATPATPANTKQKEEN